MPHALGLLAMLLAWLPAARPVGTPVALLGLGAVLVWQLSWVRAAAARWSGAVHTVVMAAPMALTLAGPQPTHGAHISGLHHAATVNHAATDGTLPHTVAVLII